MASTYSTNLALELIGTGEQSGTWGTTTNNNLGTLLEQAISGYVTQVCTGGTDTITIPNGSTGVARNMYLELTTTGGGTLVVPANKKLYFIFNNTASAITVKVSGQTGVSVPAAAKMALVCNGTDIVSAVPTFVPGMIMMWSGSIATIPTGWLLCNGSSGTPDLRNRMIIGAGSGYNVADTGGASTTTISSANLPSHTHTFSDTTATDNATHSHGITDPSHSHTQGGTSVLSVTPTSGYIGQAGGVYPIAPLSTDAAATGISVNSASPTHSHTYSGTTAATGSGTAATTISPYYALAYIMKS
jgi:microcystin-dependent protein